MKFRFRYGGYADDIVLFGPSEEALSEALLPIQKVAGDIGLDINVGKTEWLYLHYPNKEQLLTSIKLHQALSLTFSLLSTVFHSRKTQA